jgi:hypothetical protein
LYNQVTARQSRDQNKKLKIKYQKYKAKIKNETVNGNSAHEHLNKQGI